MGLSGFHRFFLGLMAFIMTIGQGLLAQPSSAAENKNGSGIDITVKDTSMIRSSRIYLGEISEIRGPEVLKDMISKIDLGPAPKPDKLKPVEKRQILSALKGRRYLPDDIVFTCAERIYVKRSSQEVSAEDIRGYVTGRLSKLFKDKEFELISFEVKGLEPYPPGEVEFFSASEGLVDNRGKLSLFVDISIDGKKNDRVTVTGQMALYETVFCVKTTHEKGETLSREQVYMQKKNIFETGDDVIKSFDEIEGKHLASGIRKGECITSKLMAVPPLIQKGDVVSLLARNKTLTVVTTGICREDGSENDVIKVENLGSGKIVRAKVREKSKVEVVY